MKQWPFPWPWTFFVTAAAWGCRKRSWPGVPASGPTLNRIEQGRNKPSVPTIAKIERALKEAERGNS